MNHISSPSSDRRQNYRLAIHHHSRLQLTLDSAAPDGDVIAGVTLTDISHEGLMASDAGQLVPGANVLLEVPLVGWREAEVRWISGNRAGCRFATPLNLDELRLAAVSSERLAGECPKLAELISRRPITEERRPAVPLAVPGRRNWSWRTGLAALGALAATSFLGAAWLLEHFF